MAEIDYGIESIVFAPIKADGSFPNFETDVKKVSIKMVDIDSFTPSEAENTKVELKFENADALTLPGDKGVKSFTFTSSNKEDEIAKAFKGMEDGKSGSDNAGWMVENPNNDDASTWAMQVITKPLGTYPAKIKQYTPVLVEVKDNSVIGKNNVGKLSFTVTRQPNFDDNGKSIPGYREKAVVVA